MNNKNLLQRTITCVVGIPLLFAIIFFLPYHNFIGLSALLIFVSFYGSYELSKMVYGKWTYMPFTALLLTSGAYLLPESTEFILVLLFLIALSLEIKRGESDEFVNSVTSISKRLLVSIYPAYFITFFIRFAAFEVTDSLVILYYLMLVFSNDIFAYICGSLFGKNNNAHLKASPKKSYAGFIGGAVFSVLLSIIYTYMLKEKVTVFGNQTFVIICPVITSIMADLGDLAESVIKRSCKVKDSSNLIPGHGGVLDRLDSIVSTAPFFYLLLRVFA